MSNTPQQLVFICVVALLNCIELNLIKREIEEDKERDKAFNQGSYFIGNDIGSIYQHNEVSLFISVIDCSMNIKLSFPPTITNYSSNYHSLLGETKYYFQQHQSLKIKPKYHNSITNETKTLRLEDDLFIHKETIAYRNTTVHIFLLRNQFVSQFNLRKALNGKATNLKFLDFYDLNIVINGNEQTIDFNGKANVVIPSLDNMPVLNSTAIVNLLSKNSFEIILKHHLITEKIKRLNAISSVLEELLLQQALAINLYNFLLSPQVTNVKSLVENVKKTLLPLISYPLRYSNEAFDYKLQQLSQRAHKVKKYLGQFDFSSSDRGIYVAYYFFFVVLLSIGGYFTALTVKEFRVAYQKKIK